MPERPQGEYDQRGVEDGADDARGLYAGGERVAGRGQQVAALFGGQLRPRGRLWPLHARRTNTTLNQMVQSSAALDRTFSALADTHRRQILDRLGEGPVSISELAAPFGMSLPGVLKHVRALEEARLVKTQKRGRTRWCQLGQRPLEDTAAWIDARRNLWNRRIDRFEADIEAAKERAL
jgi:DNA-binding transcriptional ArsR family regulator